MLHHSQLLIFILLLINQLVICKDDAVTSVYQVIRIVPTDGDQLRAIGAILQHAADMELDFWQEPKGINSSVDIRLDADDLSLFSRTVLEPANLTAQIIVDDVEKLIINREHNYNDKKISFRRLRDTVTSSTRPYYNFYNYGSYGQMVRWMRQLAAAHPDIVKFITIGKTHEGRPISGLEIGRPVDSANKRIFWIDGGIHAREWASSHTALYFIHELVTKYGRDAKLTAYVNSLTWVIIPSLNPDGYEFTRSSTNPNVRLWRKNRSPETCFRDQWGRTKCCKGVDLNRNFAFHWRETGSSDDPCSEVFHGRTVFGEPESRAVRDAVMSDRYRGRIDGFITLHTYSQLWIHPYGHRKDSYPQDVNELHTVGKKAARELTRLFGTKYVVGSGADTLYPASGGSDDWAKETAGIKYVYLLELRPDERNWDGFILDESQLIPTAQETWAGVQVVADEVVERSRRLSSDLLPPVGDADKTVQLSNMTMMRRMMVATTIDGSSSCYDLRFACKKWVQRNEQLCNTVPIFMKLNCAYSCSQC